MIIILEGEKRQEEADAIPSPKHIWIDGDRIVVYTESDIQNDE